MTDASTIADRLNTELAPYAGETLRFLLTDDFGIGEAQCLHERLIKCTRVGSHDRDKISKAATELRKIGILYSKGGGDRKVWQVNPNRVKDAEKLCNLTHPERVEGQSFDNTDLSDAPEQKAVAISIPYSHKGKAWNILPSASVEFEEKHGATVKFAPSDELGFIITGTTETVDETVAELCEATSGDITQHAEKTGEEVATAAV